MINESNANLININNSVSENIKCFIRCRPLNEKEKELGAGCIKINEDMTTIQVENKTEYKNFENKPFVVDYVLTEGIPQEEVFERIGKPILKSFIQGYNCTIFAYGQTGAGKTHTMLGPFDSIFESVSNNHGLIPRILYYIFNQGGEIKSILHTSSSNNSNPNQTINNLKLDVRCSCLEIYQEQIVDLLSNSSSTNEDSRLVIREDSKRGMFIEGLTEASVHNDRTAKELIMLGLKNRHVAATCMNAESSRSHLIFTIFLNVSYTLNDGMIVTRSSRLHLIDLAGSERQKATKAVGERIKEAGMINKSLSTLGNVINALVEMSEGRTKYVPFRDSKLTHFLKDSLGGNAKTTIVANISQSVIQIQETISTLKFVQRAKMIKNKATINENVNATVQILQDEIKRLKDELQVREVIVERNLCPQCKGKAEADEPPSPSKLDRGINELIAKVKELFSVEGALTRNFKLIDDISTNAIGRFLATNESKEKEWTNFTQQLREKVQVFSNMFESNDNIFKEIKEQTQKYDNTNIIDNLFIEKINTFLEDISSLRSFFITDDKLNVWKLNEENKTLKNQLDMYRDLNEFYTNPSYLDNLKKILDEQNIDKASKSINKFIDSNKEIKTFFEENFFNKNTFEDNEPESTDYTIIDKKLLEQLNFQLEEYKLNEENFTKQLDELQSENFLLNMELIRFKSDDQVKESRKDNELNNSFNSIDKDEDKPNIEVSEFITSSPLSKVIEKSLEKAYTAQKPSFMNKLRNSLLSTSPNKNMLRSSLLYQVNGDNPICNSITRSSLTKQNLEMIKLKEKLDDALINLEEKESEVNNRNMKIEELNSLIEQINEDKFKLLQQVNLLKEEVETLEQSNAIISNDLLNANERFNLITRTTEENLKEIQDLLQYNSNLVEFLYGVYLDDIEFYAEISKNLHLDLNRCRSTKLALEEANIKLLRESHSLKIEVERYKSSLAYTNSSLKELYECAKSHDIFTNEHIIHHLNEKIISTNIKLEELNDTLLSLCDSNKQLKKDSSLTLAENRKIKERLKDFFGSNFDYNDLLNDKGINFDKLKIKKIEKKILQLREEKKQLKADIFLLQADFSSKLSELSLNNKIHLLMRIKEENYKLKIQLNELQKKNDKLELKMQLCQEMMDQVMVSNPNLGDSFGMNYNFEEVLQFKRENRDIMERIFDLDPKHKVKVKGNKFERAMEIIKHAQEIIELHRFYVDTKQKGNTHSVNSVHSVNSSNFAESFDFLMKSEDSYGQEFGNFTNKHNLNLGKHNPLLNNYNNCDSDMMRKRNNTNTAKTPTKKKSDTRDTREMNVTPIKKNLITNMSFEKVSKSPDAYYSQIKKK